MVLRGVGHDPDPIPLVRGANCGSWYAMPLRIKPDRGQVSENTAKPSPPISVKESCDVLHEKELGSKLASQPAHFGPKAATRAIKPRPGSRIAKVLTREPAADDVNGNSIGSKPLCGEGSNVVITGHLWPVLRKHATGKGFDFAEGDGFKAARAFKAEAKSADT